MKGFSRWINDMFVNIFVNCVQVIKIDSLGFLYCVIECMG